MFCHPGYSGRGPDYTLALYSVLVSLTYSRVSRAETVVSSIDAGAIREIIFFPDCSTCSRAVGIYLNSGRSTQVYSNVPALQFFIPYSVLDSVQGKRCWELIKQQQTLAMKVRISRSNFLGSTYFLNIQGTGINSSTDGINVMFSEINSCSIAKAE